MSRRYSPSILRAALAIAAGLAVAALFLFNLPSQAQAPSGATQGSIPVTDVPFFQDWLKSPHAKADAAAFTHWDKEGKIPIPCATCHSTPGFRDFLGADGTAAGVLDGPAPIGTVITCVACHNEQARVLAHVRFPSGLRVEDVGPSARCMACHQGLAAGSDVDKAAAGLDEDKPKAELAFINVHYRAAAATLMGTLARGAYEYPGKAYASRYRHRAPYDQCITCHEVHTVAPVVEGCAACHGGVTNRASLRAIRMSKTDFDGDGDAAEGIAHEIADLHGRLLDAIRDYARTVAGTAIAYDAHAYPYFFVDTNGNGVVDKEEAKVPNKYNAWTPRLLKAAYNYQFVAKDPGAYAHNPAYTLQILIDSIADLGTKVRAELGGAQRPR